MNTVILMWNPQISDFKIEDFMRNIDDMNAPWWTDQHCSASARWAVHARKIREGDRCFMMRVGDEHAGLVMSGWIISDPYEGDNWNADGSKRLYVDFVPEVLLESSQLPHITLETLQEQFPTFDWAGGHSGRILQAQDVGRLEKLWFEYLCTHRVLFEKSESFASYHFNMEVNPLSQLPSCRF